MHRFAAFAGPAAPLAAPAFACAALVTLVAFAAPAAADPDPIDPAPPMTADPRNPTTTTKIAADQAPPLSHVHQLGLAVQLGDGVRGIATYHNSDYCGQTDSTTMTGYAAACLQRSPVMLDLALSYGVTHSIELAFGLGFGLEHDFGATPGGTGPTPFHVVPGVRFYFSEAPHSKLFVQPELVFDVTGYKDGAGASRGTDYGVGAMEGYMVDINKSFGAYVFARETIGIAHWLSATLEGGIGIQARYP